MTVPSPATRFGRTMRHATSYRAAAAYHAPHRVALMLLIAGLLLAMCGASLGAQSRRSPFVAPFAIADSGIQGA